jgi:phosphatidylinositol alpha-1,6-mannosyltransferase
VPEKLLLLTLNTFSLTGGIQKMCRVLGYTLQRLTKKRNQPFALWSAYDRPQDLMPGYIEQQYFRGFSGNRISFSLNAIIEGCRSEKVIITHINLAPIGLLIKIIKPKIKVSLIAHGIEVWRELNFIKKQFLKRCDQVIAVSEFTREKMITLHRVQRSVTSVLNNGLDPFLEIPLSFDKSAGLLKKYGLTKQHQLLFTLTRLAASEKYKGYDHVFYALKQLRPAFPNIRYILSGESDTEESKRITALLKKYEVEDLVIITGFVPDDQVISHFLLADIFVLPSKKEGFGIVFIEALSCGLPVIGGNADGSTDALLNGKLGTLINPDNPVELTEAIRNYLISPLEQQSRKAIQAACIDNFGSEAYQKAVEKTFIN